MRILLRKKFSNWKLKVFCGSNSININNKKNGIYIQDSSGDDFIDYQKHSKIINEDSKNNYDYQKKDNNYNTNYDYLNQNNQIDKNSILKNYDKPFLPVSQSNDPIKNKFITDETNDKFGNKNLTARSNNNINKNFKFEKNAGNNLEQQNNNLNIKYSAPNSKESKIKNMSTIDNNEVFIGSNKNRNNRNNKNINKKINSNIKYKDLNKNDFDIKHANTTRHRDLCSDNLNSQENENLDSSDNYQYSSLNALNNRNLDFEKFKSPKKIYDKLHLVKI